MSIYKNGPVRGSNTGTRKILTSLTLTGDESQTMAVIPDAQKPIIEIPDELLKCGWDERNQKFVGARPPFRVSKHGTYVTQNPRRPVVRGIISKLQRWSPIPHLPGYEGRWGILEFYCPFCFRTHRHGWPTYLDGRWAQDRGVGGHCSTPEKWPDAYMISPLRRKDAGYSCHIITPGTMMIRRVRHAI